MLVSNFRVEDDSTPYVFSMPPQLDNEGHDVAAYVSVRPFGKDSRDASINMSIDEAEPGRSPAPGRHHRQHRYTSERPQSSGFETTFRADLTRTRCGIAFSVEAMTETINHALTTSGLPTFQGMC
jgi:hypothetical protein